MAPTLSLPMLAGRAFFLCGFFALLLACYGFMALTSHQLHLSTWMLACGIALLFISDALDPQ